MRGDPFEYMQLSTQAAQTLVECGNMRSGCLVRGQVGFALCQLGGFAEAEVLARRWSPPTEWVSLL